MDYNGGQSEYEEESINDETSNKSTKIQSEKNLRRRGETVGEFILYCILLYCTVLLCIVFYCTVLYCIILYCTVLYFIILYCTVWYYIVLYHLKTTEIKHTKKEIIHNNYGGFILIY